MQPSQGMPTVESSSSPKPTATSPGKNIIETQCSQELDVTGSKPEYDSLNSSSEIVEVQSPPSAAFRNKSNDSVSSMDSYSVTAPIEESMETPSSETHQIMDSVGESSPHSDEIGKHKFKETPVNKVEVSSPVLYNLDEVEKKEELVVEMEAVGQNSVHRGSNERVSLGAITEVQVSERTQDVLMSNNRAESSVEELLRDLKLEDSKNTSTTSIKDDNEPVGGARKKIFLIAQQVAESPEGSSVSVGT